jgi:hypothetical protein
LFYFLFAVLGGGGERIKPRISHMLAKCSTTELHSQVLEEGTCVSHTEMPSKSKSWATYFSSEPVSSQ